MPRNKDLATITVKAVVRDKVSRIARREDLSSKKLIEIMIDNYEILKYNGEILDLHIKKIDEESIESD